MILPLANLIQQQQLPTPGCQVEFYYPRSAQWGLRVDGLTGNQLLPVDKCTIAAGEIDNLKFMVCPLNHGMVTRDCIRDA